MAGETQWCFEVLEFFRSIVALPALVSALTLIYTDNKIILALATGVALAIALGLRLLGRLRPKAVGTPKLDARHILSTTLPWLLTAALVFVLVFVIVPVRARKQGNLLAKSWLQWQQRLEDSAGKCSKIRQCLKNEQCRQDAKKLDNLLIDDSSCLAQNLGPVLRDRPRPIHETDVTGLASDLLAGQLMLANENAREILKDRLGVGERFIGGGFAEPNRQTFTAARVPEFFVPNLADNLPGVWVWKLDREPTLDSPSIKDSKLLGVLLKFRPANHNDFSANRGSLKQRLSDNDPRRVLVRFALLKEANYSGCLGRRDATRVFTIALGDVAEKTVEEAAQDSGYTVPQNSENPGLKLFIWVYAPLEAEQSVRATWGNVLDHFGSWITDESCKKQP
jgi:hypothetical protein